MTPRIVEKRRITLVGMDFFGDPYEKGGGWSNQNAIGQLWSRFERFYQGNKGSIRHQVSEAGCEVWVDWPGEEGTGNKYIFAGVEVERIDDLPLQLVAKVLPETRYAVYTLKGPEIRSDWPDAIGQRWLPEAGLQPSFHFIIERYDPQRFKGPDNPDSELDIYVPIV